MPEGTEKKLEGAAETWGRVVGGAVIEKPAHVTKEFAEEMELFGLSEEITDAPTEDEVTEPDYEVWPENLKALNLFMSLENQWDFVATADGELIRTGMKLQALEIKLKYTNGIAKKEYASFFEQMAWMEKAALGVMNIARAERSRKRAEELGKINQGRHG